MNVDDFRGCRRQVFAATDYAVQVRALIRSWQIRVPLHRRGSNRLIRADEYRLRYHMQTFRLYCVQTSAIGTASLPERGFGRALNCRQFTDRFEEKWLVRHGSGITESFCADLRN